MQNKSKQIRTLEFAPYAISEVNSRGRLYNEESSQEHQGCEYQKDLLRIYHSKAFRRLGSKTQVSLLYESENCTNRKKHSLYVAKLSEFMAGHLGLNIFAVCAIAMGHDLGHTPFGHCGERTLDKILEDHNMPGFKHNFQSLLTVNKLEQGCQENCGLNLMFETRDGILKHTGFGGIMNMDYYDADLCDGPDYPVTLEGQIVGIADEIAQRLHDTEDGLRTKRININDLLKEKLVTDCLKYENLSIYDISQNFKKNREIIISIIITALSNFYVYKTLANVNSNLKNHNVSRYADLYHQNNPIIYWDKNFKKDDIGFQLDFLYPRFYQHSEIRHMEFKATFLLKSIFNAFKSQPYKLPESTYDMFKEAILSSIRNEFELESGSIKKDLGLFLNEGIHRCKDSCTYASNSEKILKNRVICPLKKHGKRACEGVRVIINHIAGMTDKYALLEYTRLN